MNQIYVNRFWQKVNKTIDCWLWVGGVSDRGYGIFYAGKMRRAHKVAYELMVGSVPEGKELDHLCRNRLCVNPTHLEAVTHQENCIRGIGSKTHCIKGHLFTIENTKYNKRQRVCIICHKYRMKKYRLLKKQLMINLKSKKEKHKNEKRKNLRATLSR